jgi:putative PIN family toxin of toxin-antitoxin system
VRLVLDTNTAVSGLLWHGNPGKLIDAAHAGSVTLCASAPLLAELRGVLEREKFGVCASAQFIDLAFDVRQRRKDVVERRRLGQVHVAHCLIIPA